MDQKLVSVFKQSLRSVVEIIKERISRVEINVVNDNLKPGFEIKNNLKPGFEIRSIRQLEEDEIILVSYLMIQEKALKSDSKHLKAMETLTENVLDKMIEIHFYNILTSSDIKKRIVSFIITKGFWLQAVLEKRATDFEHELNDMEKRNVGLFFDVIGMCRHINLLRQKVNMKKALEQENNDIQNKKQMYVQNRDENDKSIHPFVFKKDVINCIQEVFGADGTFVATDNGWLARDNKGQSYRRYPHPIPYSTENNKIVFTFFPELKK